MPSLNSGKFLQAAVNSVLRQPECLELLIADGGSLDNSLSQLEQWASNDPRIRIISRRDNGPADALNQAFRAARGTLIGWLNTDDFYAPGALARAVASLSANPDWLMVYGEADHIDGDGEIITSYPTEQPSTGISSFNSGCFICQPSVVFRRSMGVLLGPFNEQLRTAFDFDYWLRAFAAFPDRIGYVPAVQAFSRLHGTTITSSQRQRVAIEAMQLLANQFGTAPPHWLFTAAEELLDGSDQTIDLAKLIEQSRPLLSGSDYQAAVHQLVAIQANIAKAQQGDWGALSARSLIQLLRPELMQSFTAEADPEHALWSYLLRDGIREYPYLPYDKALQNDLLQLLDHADCADLVDQVPLQPAQPLTDIPFLERSFGINLIGYAQGQLGIGEDLRCTAASLDDAGIPTAILNFPPGKNVPQHDHSLTDHLTNEGPYAFNLFCLTAEEIARFLMERGPEQFHQRFNIGYCPWELQRWPGPWLPLFGLVDELWASSLHTLSAMRQGLAAPNQAAPNPLPSTALLPLAVTLPTLSKDNRLQTRAAYGLPAQAVLFTFSFDLNSSIHRKNPLMALRAFQRAFPPDHPLADQVALLIKTHRPNRPNRDWDRLKAEAAEDQRLHILETTLSRTELLELYTACDGFISLHRAEGFGRGLAEALMLGLDVIATDHGGNTDFCTGPLAHPVRCQMVRVNNGEYPYHRGQQWAQPSVAHAAKLLQQVAERRWRDGLPDPSITADYRQHFDPAICGTRYRQQLEALWDKRHQLAHQLRFQDNGLTG